jgi:hypothetical protein
MSTNEMIEKVLKMSKVHTRKYLESISEDSLRNILEYHEEQHGEENQSKGSEKQGESGVSQVDLQARQVDLFHVR